MGLQPGGPGDRHPMEGIEGARGCSCPGPSAGRSHAVGKKKKGGKDGFKKKCCDKPVRKMCKRCPRRQALEGGTATRAACSAKSASAPPLGAISRASAAIRSANCAAAR